MQKHYPDLKAEFVEQKNREGLGQAIWLTKNLIDVDQPLIIVLGDTILDLDWRDVVNCEENCLGVKKVDDPRTFVFAELN